MFQISEVFHACYILQNIGQLLAQIFPHYMVYESSLIKPLLAEIVDDEALMRVPDSATADALIRDRVSAQASVAKRFFMGECRQLGGGGII